MEKFYGLLEAVAHSQQENYCRFMLPAHSGRYVNQGFKDLLDKYGMHRINSSSQAFANVEGLEYKDGVLGDLGPIYHKAFGSQLTLYQ